MIGTVALVVRFALYPLLGALAASGIGVIDDANGTFTVHIENAVQVISAAVLYGLTILWSRIAKKRDGKNMIGLEAAFAGILTAIVAVWLAFRRGKTKGAAEVRADQVAGSVAAERQRKEIRNDIAEDEDLAARARRGGLVRPERR